MNIKNLDYLFQNVFTESKSSQKHSSNFSNRAKFLLIFYNNTRCNKINQIAARRGDWYSLLFIHKSVTRAMLFECLMVLDHLNREVELGTFERYLIKVLTAISKLQMHFTSFLKVFKIIENLEMLLYVTDVILLLMSMM